MGARSIRLPNLRIAHALSFSRPTLHKVSAFRRVQLRFGWQEFFALTGIELGIPDTMGPLWRESERMCAHDSSPHSAPIGHIFGVYLSSSRPGRWRWMAHQSTGQNGGSTISKLKSDSRSLIDHTHGNLHHSDRRCRGYSLAKGSRTKVRAK